MIFRKTTEYRLANVIFLTLLYFTGLFLVLSYVFSPASAATCESIKQQDNCLEPGKETSIHRDLDKYWSDDTGSTDDLQVLPRYSGNGLVIAKEGSGGKLLRTPVANYFTIHNYTAGWRVKSFTVVHEEGKPLDYVREIGYRTLPSGNFCWYSTYDQKCVSKKDDDQEEVFYTLTFKKPGPIQLGLAVQIWPGYADDASRSFYIAEVELENVKTGVHHTLELEQDLPTFEDKIPSANASDNLSQGSRVVSATTRSSLQQILAGALKQRSTPLAVRYSGEALKMPDAVEAMLDAIFAGDDYLFYSLCSHNIRWSDEANDGALLLNFQFQYLTTREEENIVEKQVADILRKILTPEINRNAHLKTKAIHDYIVANVAYDLKKQDHSAYAALVKGQAVCQGYALLLHKMLDKAGIKARIVTGKAGGEKHAWNMVNLDGNWYHIDATWNDPVPDTPGRMLYNYYNRNDDQMAATHTWNRALYPAARKPYPSP